MKTCFKSSVGIWGEKKKNVGSAQREIQTVFAKWDFVFLDHELLKKSEYLLA